MQTLSVRVENENGATIVEPALNCAQILLTTFDQSHGGGEYPLLSSIDPYGDTVFNYIQCERLKVELRNLYPNAHVDTQKDIDALQELLDSIVQGHLIRFIGD